MVKNYVQKNIELILYLARGEIMIKEIRTEREILLDYLCKYNSNEGHYTQQLRTIKQLIMKDESLNKSWVGLDELQKEIENRIKALESLNSPNVNHITLGRVEELKYQLKHLCNSSEQKVAEKDIHKKPSVSGEQNTGEDDATSSKSSPVHCPLEDTGEESTNSGGQRTDGKSSPVYNQELANDLGEIAWCLRHLSDKELQVKGMKHISNITKNNLKEEFSPVQNTKLKDAKLRMIDGKLCVVETIERIETSKDKLVPKKAIFNGKEIEVKLSDKAQKEYDDLTKSLKYPKTDFQKFRESAKKEGVIGITIDDVQNPKYGYYKDFKVKKKRTCSEQDKEKFAEYDKVLFPHKKV